VAFLEFSENDTLKGRQSGYKKLSRQGVTQSWFLAASLFLLATVPLGTVATKEGTGNLAAKTNLRRLALVAFTNEECPTSSSG